MPDLDTSEKTIQDEVESLRVRPRAKAKSGRLPIRSLMRSSIEDINERLRKGEAVVLTAQEVRESLREDGSAPKDVDVVTCGTRGLMSGTYAILSFPVSKPGTFERASSASLNGVPAIPGPCPNERLGIVDLMVLGTSVSPDDRRYGAGHLFRDLADEQGIDVEVKTNEGDQISANVKLEEMKTAKLLATRHAFRNYLAIVNSGNRAMNSIFHPSVFAPSMSELTFSGCGSLNPIQNDPELHMIGIGTRVLVNGAVGYITGTGTRSSPASPNLMMIADMKGMSPEYMGGFQTSAGPECAVTWGVAIPVIDDSVRKAISVLDRDIPLPVNDLKDRGRISTADYGQVWDDVDPMAKVAKGKCEGCERCDAAEKCPTGAISVSGKVAKIDYHKCFNCGFCTTLCHHEVFQGRIGSVGFEAFGKNWNVPVVCRQSDRVRALKIAKDLKKRLLDGSFTLTQMVERL
ncbi:MAG: methanogenesis marker 16 metalloprotein [Methanomassiliicoccales archaeon]